MLKLFLFHKVSVTVDDESVDLRGFQTAENSGLVLYHYGLEGDERIYLTPFSHLKPRDKFEEPHNRLLKIFRRHKFYTAILS